MLGRILGKTSLKKHVLTRGLCFAVIVFLWVWINGGLFPRFLRQQIPMLRIGSDANILTYFPDTEDNGANIKWARGVNNLDKLERALYSRDVHMVEADVMLRGQGTDKQELTPVLAQFPDTDSELTFDDFLTHVIKASDKGIKIHFQAIDALEVTLQKMKDKKDDIKVPVWIHADVLRGPLGAEPKVDATRFIKIVKKMFPESTLSLGWTTGYHTDVSQMSYTWDMILDMYYIVHNLEIEPPIVYTARAAFLQNSVPQLKWLADNTRANVLVYQEEKDLEDAYHQSLMYLCYRFSSHDAYFDLTNEKLENFVKDNRYAAVQHIDPRVSMRDAVMFRPEAWVKMGFFIEAHSILPSTEAVVLQSRAVYMVTKGKHKPSKNVKLQGRVLFLNRKNLQEELGKTGLSIFIRSSSYMHFEDIKGIRCFIGIDGEIVVESSNLPGTPFRESQRMTPGSSNCYRFRIVDEGKELVFSVTVQIDCTTLESAKPSDRIPAEMRVKLPADIGGFETEHPFIVKLEDSKRTAIIDELTLKIDS